jgi:hypothetical protein
MAGGGQGVKEAVDAAAEISQPVFPYSQLVL